VNGNKKQIRFLFIVTIVGIIAFELCLLLLVALLIEMLLHKHITVLHALKYGLTLLDNLGHLAMVTVFIFRLKMCYEANSLFGYNKFLLRAIYVCFVVLTAIAAFLHFEMATAHNQRMFLIVMVCELAWELLVELMCLVLFYLFVSKLSELICLSLTEAELADMLSYVSVRRNQSECHEPSTHASQINYRTDMDTGGGGNDTDAEMEYIADHRFSVSVVSEVLQSRGRKTSADVQTASAVIEHDVQIIYLINVITKMSVLVSLAVSSSVLSVAASIYFQCQQLNVVHHGMSALTAIELDHDTATLYTYHSISMQWIWALLLPAVDIMMTAVCLLYLQFNYTNRVYGVLCARVDVCFLKAVGAFIRCKMKHTKRTDWPMDAQEPPQPQSQNTTNDAEVVV